jgi:signal transduction histidine kinase
MDLAPQIRDEVYRIVGEALRNAFRHADARRIEVKIHYDKRRLRIMVQDDGSIAINTGSPHYLLSRRKFRAAGHRQGLKFLRNVQRKRLTNPGEIIGALRTSGLG